MERVRKNKVIVLLLLDGISRMASFLFDKYLHIFLIGTFSYEIMVSRISQLSLQIVNMGLQLQTFSDAKVGGRDKSGTKLLYLRAPYCMHKRILLTKENKSLYYLYEDL